MKLTQYLKSHLLPAVAFTCAFSSQACAQTDKGITLSFGVMGAHPLSAEFSTTHSIGSGPISSLIIPVSFKGDLTATLKATSFLGKRIPGKDSYYKHKNVMYLLVGYRYNFNPDLESAFYLEPRVGYALIGTINKAICYEPTFGYYLNDKFDIGIWMQNTVTTEKYEKIGAIGVTVNLSFHNLLKFLNYY